MKPLSIRDLQKISAAAIARLPGPVAVRSGDDTIAILKPLKKADPKKLAALQSRLHRIQKGVGKKEQDSFFAANPDIEDLRSIDPPARGRPKAPRSKSKTKRAS